MRGFHFSKFDPNADGKSKFQQLLDLFMQLLTYTNGDVAEALQWLNQLDREYGLTNGEYGMGDFIDELKDKGYITESEDRSEIKITPKTEQGIRKKSLEEIFGKLKKSRSGNHQTFKPGQGDEISPETRPFQFGDMVEQIDFTESIRNAQINHGVESFQMYEDDLQIRETDFKTQTSTVLMIDISHSMILYGEDRITPAKKVAMALSELITTKYPKDTLDIVVFGNDAWPVEIKDLPYLQVGPYHTNTVAGLELAMDILRRRKNPNKQIFMITDGKPTCLQVGQFINYKNAAVASWNDTIVNYLFVGKAESQVGGFYRVNIANQIRHTYIRRCQLFAVAFASVNPFNRCIVTSLQNDIPSKFRDWPKRIIINITAGDHWNMFIEKFRHLSGHTCFSLSTQTQKQNIMFAQQRSFYIRYHRVFIPENAAECFFLCLQFFYEVLANFFFYAFVFIARFF